MAKHPNASDFYKFYLSSVRVRFGQSAYWPSPGLGEIDRLCGRPTPLKPLGDPPSEPKPALADVRPCLHPNLNPPVFSIFSWPLGYFHPTVAWWLWSVLSLACFGVALKLIWSAGVIPLRTWYAPALWVAASFAFLPSFVNFGSGQLGFIIFLPVTLCWLALRQGNDMAGGAWLGLAAGLKPFLGLMLVILVLDRNWRACLVCLLVLSITLMLGGLVLGFGAYQEYFNLLSRIYWHSASGNASLQGFFSRIFGGSETPPWVAMPALGQGLTMACSLLVLVVVVRLSHSIRRLTPSLEERSDAVFAIVLPAMLLISPLAWVYYLPLLILSAILLWHINSRLPAGRIPGWFIMVAVILNSIPSYSVLLGGSSNQGITLWEGSHVFYGLLVFFMLAVRLVWTAGTPHSLIIELQSGPDGERPGKGRK